MTEDRLELAINQEELARELAPMKDINSLLEELPELIRDQFLGLIRSLLLDITVTSDRSALGTFHIVASTRALRHFELVSAALATLQRQLHR